MTFTSSSNSMTKRKNRTIAIPSHPNVRLTPNIEDLSISEQIIRYVQRMESYPGTVDRIHRALTLMLLNSISNEYSNNTNNTQSTDSGMKYRYIDTTTIAYKQNIDSIPGGESLLHVLKFKTIYKNVNGQQRRYLTIDPNDILDQNNKTLLELAISSLASIQSNSIVYKRNKTMMLFNNEIRNVVKANNNIDKNSDERKERLYYTSLCPPENSTETGLGTVIEIRFGESGINKVPVNKINDKNNTSIITSPSSTSSHDLVPPVIIHRRKFNSDDTVLNVLHWLGSIGGHTLFNKLTTGEWTLLDLTLSNGTFFSNSSTSMNTGTIDCSSKFIQGSTLQSIGLWPSGRLSIRPKYTNTTTSTCNQQQQHGTANTRLATSTSTSSSINNWNVNTRALGIPSPASLKKSLLTNHTFLY